MKNVSPRLSLLIRQVREHPDDVFRAQSQACRELTLLGARAVGPVLEAMNPPYPPDQHPHDVIEALAGVLTTIARREPGPLIDLFERGTEPPFPELFFIVSALGSGPVDQVLAPLARALKHPDKDVRWSAARALIQLRTREAIGPLVAALRDRSTLVKSEVVTAMHSSKFLHTGDAIEPLNRIVQSTSIKARTPGLWRRAHEVLTRLESRFQRPRSRSRNR